MAFSGAAPTFCPPRPERHQRDDRDPQWCAGPTREVRGSNHCFIGVGSAGVPGQLVVISVIDNLVKGASGQALQNMNLLFGLDETDGLMLEPMYP